RDAHAVLRREVALARRELTHEALHLTGQRARRDRLPLPEARRGAQREVVQLRLRRAHDVRAGCEIAEPLRPWADDHDEESQPVETGQEVDDAREISDEHRGEARGRAILTDDPQSVHALAD